MRIALLALGLIFSLFPYTQILPLNTYNQPYALTFATLSTLVSIDFLTRRFPRTDAAILFGLAFLGAGTLMFTALGSLTQQDAKYLLIYVSPLVFCMNAFALSLERPVLTDRILQISAGIWIAVGVIQLLFDPTFLAFLVGEWEGAAEVVMESGRGVLGLAPEPTHFGFHMVLIATMMAVLRRRIVMPVACIVTAVLIARSSSTMLALALGSIAYLAIYTRRARLLLVGVIPAYFVVEAIVQSGIFSNDLRIIQVMQAFYDDPMILLTSDNSVNARVGGIIVGISEIVRDLVMPHGMSNQYWIDQTGRLLSEYPWLYDLSSAGIPSGFLIIIYQTGWFGLILLFLLIRRMMSGQHFPPAAWLMCGTFFVFLSQNYLSTPAFGIIYGLVLARRAQSAALVEHEMARFSPVSNSAGAVA